MEKKILNQLNEIEFEMKRQKYESVVVECVRLLEDVLKKTYAKALGEVSPSVRAKMNAAEEKQGKGVQGFQEFTFGQLVGLYVESKLLTSWPKGGENEAALIKGVSLYPISVLRNDIVHRNKKDVRREEAELVYAVLKIWLTFAGYGNLVDQVPRDFQAKTLPTHEEVKNRYQQQKQRPRENSTYTYSKKSEQIRLGKAVDIYRDIDRRALDFVQDHLQKEKKWNVLDVGCADGKILESRFSDRSVYNKAIGIDYNEEVIKKKQGENSDFYHYYCMDLESPDFEDLLDEMMEEEEIFKFDIIFSSLVIHHLKDPNKVLRVLTKKLRKGGAIILRGAEDGSKLAYDDKGLVKEIIERSVAVKGMSDRYHGRKFYSQLINCGFQKIYLLYEERDTVGKSFDERLDMYQLSFPYRKDYFERQLATDPYNEQYQEDYRWIKETLTQLEEYFVRPDFYYMEIVPVAIGFK